MALWSDIDTYLETQLLAELGRGGTYTTLVVRQVLVDDLMGFDDVIKLAAFPAVLVRSHHASQAPGPHGGGVINVENTYDYSLVAIIKSEGQRKAKQDVQEMRGRLRDFLKVRLSLGGLTATDGERVRKTEWGRSDIEVWANGNQPGAFYGVVAMDFKVLSI